MIQHIKFWYWKVYTAYLSNKNKKIAFSIFLLASLLVNGDNDILFQSNAD